MISKSSCHEINFCEKGIPCAQSLKLNSKTARNSFPYAWSQTGHKVPHKHSLRLCEQCFRWKKPFNLMPSFLCAIPFSSSVFLGGGPGPLYLLISLKIQFFSAFSDNPIWWLWPSAITIIRRISCWGQFTSNSFNFLWVCAAIQFHRGTSYSYFLRCYPPIWGRPLNSEWLIRLNNWEERVQATHKNPF